MKLFNFALIFATLVVFLQAGFLSALAAGIKWQSDIASAAAEARNTNRFMFVEISAPWCPACRQLEKLMGNSKIGEWTNSRFVSVHLSADAPDGKALLQKFGMDGIPALLVFGPDGKFKDKMSGGPEDEEGFKHFLTQMAGGEAAFANASSAGSAGSAGITGGAGSAGGNSPFPAQMDQGFNAGTADGAYLQPNFLPPPQQNYQQLPQQNYQQPAQQSYRTPTQQPFQQGFQAPQQQNYLPPAQYSQGGYPQGSPQEQIPAGYSSAPPNGFAPQQQYSQPVMQWQGQQPPTSAQYPPPQRQFQQQPGQYYQPGQYAQQFQQAPQQYPPQGQQYPAGQTYPTPGQQFPKPGQQYPQSIQQHQTQYAPQGTPIQQQQR